MSFCNIQRYQLPCSIWFGNYHTTLHGIEIISSKERIVNHQLTAGIYKPPSLSIRHGSKPI